MKRGREPTHKNGKWSLRICGIEFGIAATSDRERAEEGNKAKTVMDNKHDYGRSILEESKRHVAEKERTQLEGE